MPKKVIPETGFRAAAALFSTLLMLEAEKTKDRVPCDLVLRVRLPLICGFFFAPSLISMKQRWSSCSTL
jgi:hypothetical protein